MLPLASTTYAGFGAYYTASYTTTIAAGGGGSSNTISEIKIGAITSFGIGGGMETSYTG